eukprot:Gb_39218 [translate_table: standard]
MALESPRRSWEKKENFPSDIKEDYGRRSAELDLNQAVTKEEGDDYDYEPYKEDPWPEEAEGGSDRQEYSPVHMEMEMNRSPRPGRSPSLPPSCSRSVSPVFRRNLSSVRRNSLSPQKGEEGINHHLLEGTGLRHLPSAGLQLEDMFLHPQKEDFPLMEIDEGVIGRLQGLLLVDVVALLAMDEVIVTDLEQGLLHGTITEDLLGVNIHPEADILQNEDRPQGFSFDTTERELEKKFGRFGRVTDVRVVRDKRSGDSRGFGFLTLERDEDADEAIRVLDQTEWNGRIVLIEKAKTPTRY